LNQLHLLRRQTPIQNLTVGDTHNRLELVVAKVDVWAMVPISIQYIHADENSIEHADGRHFWLPVRDGSMLAAPA
jgi:hypothetical protein